MTRGKWDKNIFEGPSASVIIPLAAFIRHLPHSMVQILNLLIRPLLCNVVDLARIQSDQTLLETRSSVLEHFCPISTPLLVQLVMVTHYSKIFSQYILNVHTKESFKLHEPFFTFPRLLPSHIPGSFGRKLVTIVMRSPIPIAFSAT